jgi:hypothetical protein
MTDSSDGQLAKLDWSSAEVHDGKLTVPIDGDLPSGWKNSFETVAHLLNRGGWSAVKLKKGRVRVEGLSRGDEEKVRHFLESVVLQANTDHRPHEDPDEAEHDDRDDDDERIGDSSVDDEMAEQFRSFAGPSADAE